MTQQVASKIEEYFLECGPSDAKVKVEFREDKTCRVHLSKMYEGLGGWVKFSNLNWLSSVLNTEEIDLQDERYTPGCETCDYYSSTEVTIVCRNVNLPQ
jgi:hypothetical protein